MSFFKVLRSFWWATGKSPRNPALRRRLAVESLEQRALLSVVPSSFLGSVNPIGRSFPAAITTQHPTVANLPAAARQAISSALGQEAELTPSDGVAGDGYGDSVAISGNTVVVAAPFATVGGNSSAGAVYVFSESGSGWANTTQIAKLTASDDKANDDFGGSIAIDGNITFSLSAAPAGMSINVSTGLVTWVPNVFRTGSDIVTVLAKDQFGDTTQQTFSISVSGVFAPYGPIAPTKRGFLVDWSEGRPLLTTAVSLGPVVGPQLG